MPLEELPYIDEHAVDIAATPEVVWDATLGTFERSFSRFWTPAARLLGCNPSGPSGWDRPGMGTTIPGFRVVIADRPELLVVSGNHRFSRYGIVFRIEPSGEGARCSAESRAEFPGRRGTAYRLAVIGSRGHGVAVRRILRVIRQAAERANQP